MTWTRLHNLHWLNLAPRHASTVMSLSIRGNVIYSCKHRTYFFVVLFWYRLDSTLFILLVDGNMKSLYRTVISYQIFFLRKKKGLAKKFGSDLLYSWIEYAKMLYQFESEIDLTSVDNVQNLSPIFQTLTHFASENLSFLGKSYTFLVRRWEQSASGIWQCSSFNEKCVKQSNLKSAWSQSNTHIWIAYMRITNSHREIFCVLTTHQTLAVHFGFGGRVWSPLIQYCGRMCSPLTKHWPSVFISRLTLWSFVFTNNLAVFTTHKRWPSVLTTHPTLGLLVFTLWTCSPVTDTGWMCSPLTQRLPNVFTTHPLLAECVHH